MNSFTNGHDLRLLAVIFKDGDWVHIRPGETLNFSREHQIVKTLYV